MKDSHSQYHIQYENYRSHADITKNSLNSCSRDVGQLFARILQNSCREPGPQEKDNLPLTIRDRGVFHCMYSATNFPLQVGKIQKFNSFISNILVQNMIHMQETLVFHVYKTEGSHQNSSDEVKNVKKATEEIRTCSKALNMNWTSSSENIR